MSRRRAALAGVVALLAMGGVARHLHRRALPQIHGQVRAAGVRQRVEIVRDRWGVPHIFAGNDHDAYFGLGYAAAQDRLFQLELHRRIGQARLAELFGEAALPIDRLFRTMDFHGIGRRHLATARPEVRDAFAAYAGGVNAAVEAGGGRQPIEFLLLRHTFGPVAADDYVGVLGYMTWILNAAWEMDPLYESLAARVGEPRAASLFPYDKGGAAPVFDDFGTSAPIVAPRALSALLGIGASSAGSNTWVIAPRRSATGHALLANDPHLLHGLPSLWYEAHLHAPGLEVAGMTLPGLPLVIIGRNRRIAWGATNLMLDGADFFLERLEGEPPTQALYRNARVPLRRRPETIKVKGGSDEVFEVVETPHGPLVDHLLDGAPGPTAYRWIYAAALDANDFDAFYMLNRARDWASFRDALSRLGAVSQNMSYADVDGHIGLQATGRIPRRRGRGDGNRFRVGWDGRDEWDGFVPFSENPHSFDPPSGWLAAANNVALAAMPYFLSSHWEPLDRYLRIRAVLESKPQVTMEDLRALQADVTLALWPEMRDALRVAFAGEIGDPATAAVAARLLRWDGAMTPESADAAVFAAFYKHLFHEIVGDEMGDLSRRYRSKTNVSASMIRAALFGSAAEWLDDVRTPVLEDRDAVLQRALGHAVEELRACCGADAARWSWGARHRLRLKHPLGRGAVLGTYFNLGPFPMGGHALTVNKAEFVDDDYQVMVGPSMRLLVDMGRVADALSSLPAGQSGIPASPHHHDQLEMWRTVQHHPSPMDRAAIDAVAEGTLILEP